MVSLQEQERLGNLYISFSIIRQFSGYSNKYIYVYMYIVSDKCDGWFINKIINSFTYKSLDILD